MVENPKPDRTYLVYAAVILGLVLITVFNALVLTPALDLTIFKQENNLAREFLVAGVSPYDGLSIIPSSANDLAPGDVVGVSHKPFYRSLLDLPLAAIPDVNIAAALQLTLLELAFALTLGITAKMLYREGVNFGALAVLVPIFAIPGLWSMVRLGDSTIILLALMMLSIWSLDQGYEELSGVLLALSFTSIEALGIAFISIFLWLAYTRRVRVLVGFGLTMALLLLTAHVFYPGWYIGYLKSQYLFYQQAPLFTTAQTFGMIFPGVGINLSRIVAVLFLAALMYEWITISKRDARSFIWVLCLSLAIPPLLGIGSATQWMVVNMVAFGLIHFRFVGRWKKQGYWIAILVLLSINVWSIFLLNPASAGMAIFWQSFGLTILLYWVRWDSVRTTRLWADILEDQGKI